MKSITHRRIKQVIRKHMYNKSITTREMSHKSGLSMVLLLNIVYNPFYKIKMTQGVAISQTLGCKVLDLL
jgi:DNA-binding LacI/PurR family transcriptional regulator